jgi:menaquinone-dependent protoporphyrinogen oxidase
MKTLIVFASKHGGTRIVAEKIAKAITLPEMQFPEIQSSEISSSITNQFLICELGKNTIPNMNQFDCIIVGGPVFAGTIQKEVSSFVKDNLDVLLTKKIGLFIAGLKNSESKEAFSANVPEALVKHAAAKEMTGGICDPKTLGFFLKVLMRAITKTSKYHCTISDEKIKRFAAALK